MLSNKELLKQVFDSYVEDQKRGLDNFFLDYSLDKLELVIIQPLGVFFDQVSFNYSWAELDKVSRDSSLYIYYVSLLSEFLETTYGKDKAVYIKTILQPVINPYLLYGFSEKLYTDLAFEESSYYTKLKNKAKTFNLDYYYKNISVLGNTLKDMEYKLTLEDLELIPFEYFDNRIYYVLITKYLYITYHSKDINPVEWLQGINKIADDNMYSSISNLYIYDFDLYYGYSRAVKKPMEYPGTPTINIPLLSIRTELEKTYGPLTVDNTKLKALYNDFLKIPSPSNVYNLIVSNYLDPHIVSLIKEFNDFIKSLHLEQLSKDQQTLLMAILAKINSIVISWANMFTYNLDISRLNLEPARADFINKTRLDAYTELDLIKYYEIDPIQGLFDNIKPYIPSTPFTIDSIYPYTGTVSHNVSFSPFLQKPINLMKIIKPYSNTLSKYKQFEIFDETVFRPTVKFYLTKLRELSYSFLNKAIDGYGDYRGESFIYLKTDLQSLISLAVSLKPRRGKCFWMEDTFAYYFTHLFNFNIAGISANYSKYINTVSYTNTRTIKPERNLEFSIQADKILISMDNNLKLILSRFFNLPESYPAYNSALYTEFLNRQYPGWADLLNNYYILYNPYILAMPSRLSLFFPRLIYSLLPYEDIKHGKEYLDSYKGAYASSSISYNMYYIFYPDYL